jgi:hypothetical protein
MRHCPSKRAKRTYGGELFENDFAIDIVAGFNRMSDGTTAKLLSAVFSGSGGPVAITTVVASLSWRHITTIIPSSRSIAVPLPCAGLLYHNSARRSVDQY